MGKHGKKLIAPVVITSVMVLVFLVYLMICLFIPLPLFSKLIGVLVCFGLIGVSIYVLVQRIHEVRSGEEDDLSQY